MYTYIYTHIFSHKLNIKHEVIPVINQSLGQCLACMVFSNHVVKEVDIFRQI